MLKMIELFTANHSKILQEIRGFNYLLEREKKRVEYYIDDFYKEISHTKSFLRMIERSCDPIN